MQNATCMRRQPIGGEVQAENWLNQRLVFLQGAVNEMRADNGERAQLFCDSSLLMALMSFLESRLFKMQKCRVDPQWPQMERMKT